MRKLTPGTTGAQQVQDPVDHLPKLGLLRPTARLGLGKHRSDQLPLPVAQVAGVPPPPLHLLSLPPMHGALSSVYAPTSRVNGIPTISPFSDTLLYLGKRAAGVGLI
jgi:hypothetical protein